MPNNSKGCCIFAFNTDDIDYISDAVLAGERVNRYLDLPVTIISDREVLSEHDNIVIDAPDHNRRLKKQWFNLTRTQAYDLTPYDRTLVIDSDYFICSDTLVNHINGNADFAITTELYDPISGVLSTEKLAKSAIPLRWATVMLFNKSIAAYTIFQCAKMIQTHYDYYAALYKFYPTPVRNDYIFSLACHIAAGYGMADYGFANYPLINMDNRVKYSTFDNNSLTYEYTIGDKLYRNKFKNTDLHLMNKVSK